jgi:DNA-binding transcriptional ArsR family regulator
VESDLEGTVRLLAGAEGSFRANGDGRSYYAASTIPRLDIAVGDSVILNLMVQYQTIVDRAFAALADPTRRAVLERLGAGGATISELAEPFGMSLTGMRKHVRLLEDANLVATEKVGRARRCVLVPYAFEGISTWLQRLDRFAQVVERTKGAR